MFFPILSCKSTSQSVFLSMVLVVIRIKKGKCVLVMTASVGLKSEVKPPTNPPHPHPSPRTPYQQSGTTGGPIRPRKQQYIPPKRSIFLKNPQSWVTTGYVGLKSKVKPLIQQPHSHPSPGTPYQQSGTTGGPIRPWEQQYIPPKRSIFPRCP